MLIFQAMMTHKNCDYFRGELIDVRNGASGGLFVMTGVTTYMWQIQFNARGITLFTDVRNQAFMLWPVCITANVFRLAATVAW